MAIHDKMRVFSAFCLLAPLIFLVPSLRAQDAATLRLSLRQATELTLKNYEKVKIAATDVQAARGRKWQNYSRILPNLSGSYQYTRNLQKPSIFFESGKVPIGFDNAHTFRADLQQPLTNFGGIYHGIRSGKLYQEAAAFSEIQTQADAVFEARRAYFNVLLQEGRVRTTQFGVEASQAILKREQARFEAGEIAEFDLNRAKLEAEGKQNDLLQAQGDRQIARNLLYRLTDLDPAEEVALSDALETFAKPVTNEEVLNQWNERVPSIASLKKNADAAEQARKSTRAELYPTIRAFSGYLGSGESSERFFPDSREFSNSATLGVNVQVPIFDGLYTLGKYKVSAATAQRAFYEKKLQEKDLLLALKQNLTTVQTQWAQQKHDRESVALARTLYRQAQLRFENNLLSFIDLKDVQNQIELANLRYLSTLYEYLVGLARIEQILGSRSHEF